MQIKDFLGVTVSIDSNKIQMKSTSQKEIRLPYSGVLPFSDPSNTKAWIYFNIQPGQKNRIIFFFDDGSAVRKFPVIAANREIMNILDAFFSKPNRSSSGLLPYWEGFWHGCYTAWRRMTLSPWEFSEEIKSIWDTLDDERRELLRISCRYIFENAS